MKYCLWYQVCRMFERARIELAGFNRVDRSVDTAQKPLRIGCEVKKGFDDSEIRAEFSELPLGIFSSTRNFSHWIFKTFLLFFFSLLFSPSFFLFSFLSRSTAAPLDYRIDDRKRRISRAYELLHSIPLINHSLRLYYHDHAKSMETRYALFISITGNFFSLFNIDTIFFYSFSSFFFPLFFFLLSSIYTYYFGRYIWVTVIFILIIDVALFRFAC